ncbi:toxin [Bacteroides acidifaciens]|uniref:toxin n=1 Tax=Bacteroides acidifaciens TaxID=85831 RepID=UPI002595770E|nr:toxin [Bacteroides acidifaciens]
MTTRDEVESFLAELHAKLKIRDVIYKPRGKNQQALLDLEITSLQRTERLQSLKVSDYSEGPLEEILDKGADMWVFGIDIKGKEVYIKLSKGMSNGPVICHSFHVAEHKMNHPFKK